MQSENDESWVENQCLEALNSQPDFEKEYVAHRESTIRNVYSGFQDSATAIAQLYRGKMII